MDNGHDRKRGRNVAKNIYSTGPSAVLATRWSPTIEQKNMLMSLYRQGIKKPSPDQIRQITTRLRALGHVEDKNVFYWFHNYKAKERAQMLKQNREESSTPPPPPPPPPNVPIGNSNKKLSTTTCRARRSLRFEKLGNNTITLSSAARSGYEPVSHCTVDASHVINDNKNGTTMIIGNNIRETLELFPLTPTGIFHARNL